MHIIDSESKIFQRYLPATTGMKIVPTSGKLFQLDVDIEGSYFFISRLMLKVLFCMTTPCSVKKIYLRPNLS